MGDRLSSLKGKERANRTEQVSEPSQVEKPKLDRFRKEMQKAIQRYEEQKFKGLKTDREHVTEFQRAIASKEEHEEENYIKQAEKLELFVIDPRAERPTSGRSGRITQLIKSFAERDNLYNELIMRILHISDKRIFGYQNQYKDIEQQFAMSGVKATHTEIFGLKTQDGALARNEGEDAIKMHLNRFTYMLRDLAIDQRVFQLENIVVRDRIIDLRNAVDKHLQEHREDHREKDRIDEQIKHLLDLPATEHEKEIATIRLQAARKIPGACRFDDFKLATRGRSNRITQLNHDFGEQLKLYNRFIREIPPERIKYYQIKEADIERKYVMSGIKATYPETQEEAQNIQEYEAAMQSHFDTLTHMLRYDMRIDRGIAGLENASVRDRIIDLRNAVDKHLQEHGEDHQEKDRIDEQIKHLLDLPATEHEKEIATIRLQAVHKIPVACIFDDFNLVTRGRSGRITQLNSTFGRQLKLYNRSIQGIPPERIKYYQIKEADIERKYVMSGIKATHTNLSETDEAAMQSHLDTLTNMLRDDMPIDRRVNQLENASVRNNLIGLRNYADRYFQNYPKTKAFYTEEITKLLGLPPDQHEEALAKILSHEYTQYPLEVQLSPEEQQQFSGFSAATIFRSQ